MRTVQFSVLLLLLSVVPQLCANSTELPAGTPANAKRAQEKLMTLEELMSPPSTATTGVNSLRSQLLTEGGHTAGFRGGMLERSARLIDDLNSRAQSLDKMFQFASLIGKGGTIPPVVVQAQDVSAFAPDQIRTANQVYKIEKEERFVSTPPTWRDYLLSGLPVKGKIELPMFEARPQDGKEMAVWRQAVEAGWIEGRAQADAILEANFNRLTRDYTGMLLYSALLQQGIVSGTRVAELAQTVTGDGKQIMIGDTLRRVTGKAVFDTDHRNWQPRLLFNTDVPTTPLSAAAGTKGRAKKP
jgi:defect-in-organelle-trafficking protein DotC